MTLSEYCLPVQFCMNYGQIKGALCMDWGHKNWKILDAVLAINNKRTWLFMLLLLAYFSKSFFTQKCLNSCIFPKANSPLKYKKWKPINPTLLYIHANCLSKSTAQWKMDTFKIFLTMEFLTLFFKITEDAKYGKTSDKRFHCDLFTPISPLLSPYA